MRSSTRQREATTRLNTRACPAIAPSTYRRVGDFREFSCAPGRWRRAAAARCGSRRGPASRAAQRRAPGAAPRPGGCRRRCPRAGGAPGDTPGEQIPGGSPPGMGGAPAQRGEVEAGQHIAVGVVADGPRGVQTLQRGDGPLTLLAVQTMAEHPIHQLAGRLGADPGVPGHPAGGGEHPGDLRYREGTAEPQIESHLQILGEDHSKSSESRRPPSQKVAAAPPCVPPSVCRRVAFGLTSPWSRGGP